MSINRRTAAGRGPRRGEGGSRLRRPVTGLMVVAVASLALLGAAAQSASAAANYVKVVFQANTTDLAGYSSSGSNFSTTLGMHAGTSPSVAQLADGTYEAAFEANNNDLAFSHLGGGTLSTTLGMDPGTGPAIAALPAGGWVAAFQDNADKLYLYTSAGQKTDTDLGMDPGTSPAIAVQSDGSYRVVFQDNDNVLAGYNSSGSNYTTTVGMQAASSPAIAAKTDGSYEVALEANTDALATVHLSSGYSVNTTTLGMAAGTSPAVAVQSDDSFQVVFEANTNTLHGYESSGGNFSTTVGMTAGTSPSLVPLSDGSYEAAFETNDSDLGMSHISAGGGYTVATTTLGMDAGTSPAIALPAAAAPSTVAALIAKLATDNVGKGAGTCSTANSALNSLGGTAFYTSCTGNGGDAEFWCADFAKWVWANAGVNVSGLNAGAASFVYNASSNGSTVHTSASYNPQVGDAIVYNYNSATQYANHVDIVTAVNSDGSITTANGDWGGTSSVESTFAKQSEVVSITIASSQKHVGAVPSGIGMTISDIVTPSGI